MKKLLLPVLISLVVSVTASAQAYEGSTRYDKKSQKAIIIDYAYPPEAVENAIIKKMADLGYKPKEEKGIFNRDKGFLVFKNAYVTDISDARMDYIINVERRSRKASDASTLYIVMTKGDENALEKMPAENVGKAKVFLNNMLPEIETANLELQIQAQEELVAKTEKKLRDLRDDQADLEKKLEENKKDQESTQKDIEHHKQALETLVEKRKRN